MAEEGLGLGEKLPSFAQVGSSQFFVLHGRQSTEEPEMEEALSPYLNVDENLKRSLKGKS